MKSLTRNVMIRSIVAAALLSPAFWSVEKSKAIGQASNDALERGFKNPPDEAKPRVWWHWMNGNVTKEGITADLEWMKRVGIGGVQMFDANIGNIFAGEFSVKQYVDKRIVYHTPEWKEMVRFAAAECDRLGLEMTMHSSGGWSETGGPWVKPHEAMKKLVWSETLIDGGRKFSGKLDPPPSNNGPFQNVPRRSPFGLPTAGAPDQTFYADSAVIAYRLPDDEAPSTPRRPRATASDPGFNVAPLFDNDINKTVSLPVSTSGQPAWIQLEFAEPFRARAFTIAASPSGIPNGELQASSDGVSYRTLVSMPGQNHGFLASFPLRTYSFPEVTAKYYRVVLKTPPIGMLEGIMGAPPAKHFSLAELDLHSGARVNRWEDKAGFGILFEYDSVPTPSVSAASAISRSSVVDLTSKMGKDGSLEWDAPAGRWAILRMGYSLTGAVNAPAPIEATGYEVDKLSRKHIESYFTQYLNPISEAMGPLYGKSLQYILMDSWEAGLQNWTEEMISEFRTRRGYDPTPFLPALTGRVVESSEASDRFLWDFRRTIADMLADYHYAYPAEMLARRGIKIYGESAGANNPMFQDALQNKGRSEIPMGEFWVLLPGQTHRPEHVTDIREAASAAHVYGKRFVAAESFTSFVPGWTDSPSSLKWIGDHYMTFGVNRFVIHCSVHQPFLDRRPGFTLGPFGQHFTRNNTWAEQSRGWISHLSRSSFMLQQGLFVGDLAYYLGEGAPSTVYAGSNVNPSPAPPAGYAYDYVNTEVLLTRTTVKDGRLVLPDGMSYRALVLPDHLNRMTLPALRKIRELVAAGATVIGPGPKSSPSLSGYPAADDEIRAIANEVWGGTDGRTTLEHAYGKGKVYWGMPLVEALAALNTPPDFEFSRPRIDTTIEYIHRRLGDAEIYFVTNQKDREESVEARFRVAGKAAELWHPETGEIGPASYSIGNGRTTVPLHLGPHESVFVVFRGAATSPSRTVPRTAARVLATLQGAWNVSFPRNQGAPQQIRLDSLSSWTTHADEGVKYFSGTAVYTKEFEVPASWLRPGTKLMLDLGRVKEVAEVSVNGKPAGLLWRRPFQADVTGILKPGVNRLEIKITNLWQNRMIGDEHLPAEKRATFAFFRPYKKDSPLAESGLLGPVTLSALSQQ